MCGIGGIMMYGKNRNKEELAFIKELATNIAIENQARGSHATGIAVLGEHGHDVLKHNVGADEFTTYDTYFDFLDKNINNNTYNILIHTRYATKGSPTVNANNHPIVTATAIGVHNGWVSNDDELFESEGLYRLAQVDSEVIFRLADKELGNDMENTKNVAEKLSGVYAVAFCKKDEPNKLNYFRSSNPTTFAYIPELNIIVFASEEKFVRKAISDANIALFYETGFSISELSVQYYNPTRDIVYQFDVTENTPIQQLEQTPLSFKDNDDWFSYGYGNKYYQGWYDDDWYGDYKDSRTTTTTNEEKVATNVYEFMDEIGMEHLMSDEDFTRLIEYLDQLEKNEWSKGYVAGRQSTENDTKLLKEQIKSQAKLAN
jgi:glucosamine 6-phosphate synthetase-like amidotransferase/phosphosugar isomerase protein